MTITKEAISAMSAKERSDLLSTLWDVMENDPYTDDLGEETNEEKNLLGERLEEYKRNPSTAKSWEETFAGLKNRSNAS
jgi:putative addiction module component (TIGR02574 family)